MSDVLGFLERLRQQGIVEAVRSEAQGEAALARTGPPSI
jgi:hypothetical protein